MGQRPEHDDRDEDVRADTPDERMKEDSEQDSEQEERPSGQSQGTPMKGTDTLATTDVKIIDREKGKRTTM